MIQLEHVANKKCKVSLCYGCINTDKFRKAYPILASGGVGSCFACRQPARLPASAFPSSNSRNQTQGLNNKNNSGEKTCMVCNVNPCTFPLDHQAPTACSACVCETCVNTILNTRRTNPDTNNTSTQMKLTKELARGFATCTRCRQKARLPLVAYKNNSNPSLRNHYNSNSNSSNNNNASNNNDSYVPYDYGNYVNVNANANGFSEYEINDNSPIDLYLTINNEQYRHMYRVAMQLPNSNPRQFITFHVYYGGADGNTHVIKQVQEGQAVVIRNVNNIRYTRTGGRILEFKALKPFGEGGPAEVPFEIYIGTGVRRMDTAPTAAEASSSVGGGGGRPEYVRTSAMHTDGTGKKRRVYTSKVRGRTQKFVKRKDAHTGRFVFVRVP